MFFGACVCVCVCVCVVLEGGGGVRLSMMAIGVYRSFGFVVAYYDENNIDDIWLQWRHETN